MPQLSPRMNAFAEYMKAQPGPVSAKAIDEWYRLETKNHDSQFGSQLIVAMRKNIVRRVGKGRYIFSNGEPAPKRKYAKRNSAITLHGNGAQSELLAHVLAQSQGPIDSPLTKLVQLAMQTGVAIAEVQKLMITVHN